MSESSEFELVLDVSGDEEDGLGLAMLFKSSDGKSTTTTLNDLISRTRLEKADTVTKTNQPNRKADRKTDDQNMGPAVTVSQPTTNRLVTDLTSNLPNSGSDSVDHAASTFYPNFVHITAKELLSIMYKNKVLVLGELSSELMAEISQVPHVYILQSTEEARLEQPDEWQHAFGVFLSLMDQPLLYNNRDQWMFIFVDPSIGPPPQGPDIGWNTLQHYQYGELVCENMLGITKVGMPTAISLISPKPSEKAKKRGSVLLPCPVAEKRKCCTSAEVQQWKCDKCNQELEYGFDGCFYCECGKAPADSFLFHCGKPRHGREHMGFQDLEAALQLIKPFKEINILVLGETGVGKSTWINGFGNFLTYATLVEALHDPVYLIPAQFTTMDSNFNETVVSMGSSDNEATMTGQSATQMPKTYAFRKGNVLVRLIDTPGIGDTRGTEQDKKNFIHIMQHLAGYENLHGICILLKPNSARLTVMFQFCVKELLTHLHRDACHNITFIFTNARATFYRPGDTFPTLKELIKNSKGVDITLNKDTVYCVDSEAVRFMAALKAGVEFDQTERENFVKSWEKSVEETTRLLEYISTRPPHVLQNTLSLNEARRMILSFTEPLTHITKNIQTNLRLADDKAEEIKAAKRSREKLRYKLYMPVLDLEMVQLDFPRTVCIAQSCIRMVGQKVDYVTWCHEHCDLDDIVPNQYPQPGLKRCTAMQASGGLTCSKCQCTWEKHMHITYELHEIQSQEVDQSIVDLMRHKDGEITAVQHFLEELEQRKTCLLAEVEEIRKLSAKFGYFLKKNAMLPYNDAMEGYLRHLISAEEEKVAIGASRDCLRNYEKMLIAYGEEKRILEEAMQNVDDEHQITAKDITEAMQSLFSLPIYGQTIRNMVDVVQNAQGQQLRHCEISYAPKQSRKTVRRRNAVQSILDMLNFGYESRARDEYDNSGQQRPGRLPDRDRRSGSERQQYSWRDRRAEQSGNQQHPEMRGYANSRRQDRMPDAGDYPRIEHTSEMNYGYNGRTEWMSESRMSRPQYDDLPRGRGPYGGSYLSPTTARPSSPPGDIDERLSMLERAYRRFQHW